MILLTIGTQLPFDRLVRAVDGAAPLLAMPLFAQIGRGQYRPQAMDYCESQPAEEFTRLFARAETIVAHAGIGTVLTAQKLHKPIIIFPRRAALGEHRNDHQLATCAQLEGRPGIHVAWTEDDLVRLLMTPALPYAQDNALAEKRAHFIDNLRLLLAS